MFASISDQNVAYFAYYYSPAPPNMHVTAFWLDPSRNWAFIIVDQVVSL